MGLDKREVYTALEHLTDSFFKPTHFTVSKIVAGCNSVAALEKPKEENEVAVINYRRIVTALEEEAEAYLNTWFQQGLVSRTNIMDSKSIIIGYRLPGKAVRKRNNSPFS